MTEIDINPEIGGGSLDRKLLWQAAELLVSTQFGSQSMLQRKLRIGWEQTRLVMDAMETLGVVGTDQGSRARDVLIRLVEDLEPVYEALYGDGPTAAVFDLPTAREAADPAGLAAVPYPVVEAVEPVDFTRPAPEFDFPQPAGFTKPHPTAPAEPVDEPEPEPEHGRAVEGTVFTADEWELRPDPEGDRPWINPALRTPEGRKARARYIGKQARRRARKAAARQRTVHGVVPRIIRGERRARAWVVGVEGAKARADVNLAMATIDEANRAARRALLPSLKRKEKRAAAVQLQQDAGKQLAVAQHAKKHAQRIVATRAGFAYGSLVVADTLAYGFTNVWGFLGALALNLAGASWLGRDVEMTEEQLAKLEQIEAGMPQEFTIGMTPKVFETMARQALVEKLKCEITSLQVFAYEWGFEIQVVLDGMTPERIANGLSTLEANLPGVRTSSVQLRQSMKSRNRCTIVVPGPNPWKSVPELPYRAPKSLTTKDIHTAQLAASMSGDVLGLPMCRTNVNMVGKSRAGKSTWLRAVLDALTATNDQIVIGIDLGSAGSGFGGLRKGMHLTVTDPEFAAEVLDWALAVGKGRPVLFDELGMGLNWQTSPERPGVKVVVDEFPALVKASRKPIYDGEGKKIGELDLDGKLQELAVTSSKSDVTLAVAGQGLTRALIGKNTWLTELPVQVMCACDVDDLMLLMPAGAMDEGWCPNRLVPAMGDDLNDVSVAYVLAGSQHSEAITYRACITSDEEYLRRGTERGQDLIGMDTESEEFHYVTLADLMAKAAAMGPTRRRPAGPPHLITLIRQIFEAVGDPAGLSQEELAAALGRMDPGRWSLERFEGADEAEQTAARIEAVRAAINAVLEPTEHSWQLEKYSKSLPRGYRLRDLKVITGEAPKGS
ncbi:DNA translocase FtsK [Streptomyces lunaelactis]|uniref:DNA translocase FtsK n=1 Tax=Streptomyces lunaelactis TaxID=1535768 RepID=UPI0020C7CCD0|nr:DNA translocase FtsK [Streptomyces lunaelactis]